MVQPEAGRLSLRRKDVDDDPHPRPPGCTARNLLIDLAAGQAVFTDSTLTVWQVPRDVYRQCLVSDAELRLRVATTGPLGRYRYDEVAVVLEMVGRRLNPCRQTTFSAINHARHGFSR